MKINPKTPVILIARYTLAGAAGAYENLAAWVSDNANDVFKDQKDDPAGGVAQVVLDGSANGKGATSTPSVSADIQEGAGDTQLGGKLSEAIEWTPDVMLADSVTLEISMGALGVKVA